MGAVRFETRVFVYYDGEVKNNPCNDKWYCMVLLVFVVSQTTCVIYRLINHSADSPTIFDCSIQ